MIGEVFLMGGISTAGLVAIGIILVLALLAMIRAPIRLLFKFLINTVVGFLALLAVNWLGGFVGIAIAVNWVNAAVVGILGVPGVALLLLLRWLHVI